MSFDNKHQSKDKTITFFCRPTIGSEAYVLNFRKYFINSGNCQLSLITILFQREDICKIGISNWYFNLFWPSIQPRSICSISSLVNIYSSVAFQVNDIGT